MLLVTLEGGQGGNTGEVRDAAVLNTLVFQWIIHSVAMTVE
jgi:hypothetical protein